LLPKVFFAWASYSSNCQEKRDIVSAALKRKGNLIKLLSEMEGLKAIAHKAVVHTPAIPSTKACFMGNQVDDGALDENLVSFSISTSDNKTLESRHIEINQQSQPDFLRDGGSSNRNKNLHKDSKGKISAYDS
jgi:hypothetical protein